MVYVCSGHDKIGENWMDWPEFVQICRNVNSNMSRTSLTQTFKDVTMLFQIRHRDQFTKAMV